MTTFIRDTSPFPDFVEAERMDARLAGMLYCGAPRQGLLIRCFAAHGVDPIKLQDRFDADRVNDYFSR